MLPVLLLHLFPAAQLLGRDPGLRGDEPVGQFHIRHLQGEKGDGDAPLHGGETGHVQAEGGLAVRRARPDDDQISGLPAHRDLVQGGEARGHAGEAVRLLLRLDALQGTIHGVTDLHVAGGDIALHRLEDRRLRLFDEAVHLAGLVEGVPEDAVARFDEVALDGLLLEDLDVEVDVGRAADPLREFGEQRRAAHRRERAVEAEAFRDRHEVHGRPLAEEADDGGEDEPEFGVVETFLFQGLDGLEDALVVDHHRADHGGLHLRGLRGPVPRLFRHGRQGFRAPGLPAVVFAGFFGHNKGSFFSKYRRFDC